MFSINETYSIVPSTIDPIEDESVPNVVLGAVCIQAMMIMGKAAYDCLTRKKVERVEPELQQINVVTHIHDSPYIESVRLKNQSLKEKNDFYEERFQSLFHILETHPDLKIKYDECLAETSHALLPPITELPAYGTLQNPVLEENIRENRRWLHNYKLWNRVEDFIGHNPSFVEAVNETLNGERDAEKAKLLQIQFLPNES